MAVSGNRRLVAIGRKYPAWPTQDWVQDNYPDEVAEEAGLIPWFPTPEPAMAAPGVHR